MPGSAEAHSRGVAKQARAVLSGGEAVARVERSLLRNALVRDSAVAEGLALAGVRAASSSRGRVPTPDPGIVLHGTSCVHHVQGPPGQAGGAFELAAGSAQQATDHCLAAHVLSTRLGRVGLCSLDASLAEGLSLVSLPGADLVAQLLDSEPPAPELAAGPDRIVELAREVLGAVGTHTQRPGDVVEYQGDEGPTLVFVAAGAASSAATRAARLLSEAGLPAGALSVLLVRPFPEVAVRAALDGARLVLVLDEAGGSDFLFRGVRAAIDEKTALRPIQTDEPARMIQAIADLVPGHAFEPASVTSEQPMPPSRRLAVAPAGPWGEETARATLAALSALGPLRMDHRLHSERGAAVLAWEITGVGEPGGDLLLASHPVALRPDGALSLIRPGSAVVVLSDAASEEELARRLAPETRDALLERDVQLHWVAPPAAADEASPEQTDRSASLVLAGAAVAALAGPAASGDVASGTLDGASAARWLRAGAEGVRRLALAEIDPSRLVEEIDFRPAPKLPRMPEAVEDPEQRERWARWIRRFHLTGVAPFDPAPRIPVQPAVLDALAESLRQASPHPFVLVTADRGVVTRGLRELLHEGIAFLHAGGRSARALTENIDRLAAVAARVEHGSDSQWKLGDLLGACRDRLVAELALPRDETQALTADLDELRASLPGDAPVLSLRADTPLRVYLAVLEAVRGPQRRSFAERLQKLHERLRDLLQLDHMGSSEGRAPQSLAAELGGAGADYLDLEALSRTLPGKPSSGVLEEARRTRIQEALEIIEHHLEQPAGPGALFLRPPEVGLPLPPEQQHEHPDPLAAAVGYFDGIAQRMAPLFRAVRVAELEADGRYRAEAHDALLADFDWEAFSAEELMLLPPLAVVTTGRRLRQRGQGSLSGLLRSSRPVHVIVQDEVAPADEAEDLSQFYTSLGYLVMAHREAFAVASTLARPEHLTEGLVRMAGATRPGVVLAHLPTRSLATWHPLLAEAALHGRACPDFRYDPDAGPSWADRFDLAGNPEPERAWPIHRVAYLEQGEEKSLEVAFTFADAVALEPAYLRHVRIVPRAAWDDAQQPLAEYLDHFDPEGRQRSIPYLWVVDDAGELQRAVVTRALALACRDRLRAWRVLQELAGYENAFAERAAAAARQEALDQAARERAQLEQVHADELARARSEAARESMERLAAVLLSPDGVATGVALPPRSAAPAPVLEPAAADTAAAVPAPEAAVEEEALAFDEPYIDSPLCTTCNECTNLNSRMFRYNEDKQAYLADPGAGTFGELVKAAELCPARCIHPGKPRSGDSTATPELVARAAPFN